MMGTNEFDDIWEVGDEEPVEENRYLSDPHQGLALVARLMEFKKQGDMSRIKKLDYMLDTRVIRIFSQVGLPGEVELYNQLQRISGRLFERKRMWMLNHKTVIGIGGKFSAGKSCFINSILQRTILPENQTPTTSIPTYIVAGQSDGIRAYTYSDNDVPLSEEEAQALTHAFYEKYRIGFTQFVSNLVINVEQFQYPHIAILDTPGYSKEDSGIKQSISDSAKAYAQLKSADFMIWLVDIENGTISGSDLDFLRSIAPENPVLVVFNKCDKKTAEDVGRVVEQTRAVLKTSGIPLYDVISYSSIDPQKYDPDKRIDSFFELAEHYNEQKESLERKISGIADSLSQELQRMEQQTKSRCSQIGAAIYRSNDPMDIKALTVVYSGLIKKIRDIKECSREFEEVYGEIGRLLAEIREEGKRYAG